MGGNYRGLGFRAVQGLGVWGLGAVQGFKGLGFREVSGLGVGVSQKVERWFSSSPCGKVEGISALSMLNPCFNCSSLRGSYMVGR